MKLTKQTLKRIIKEELNKVLTEDFNDPSDPRNWGESIETMNLDSLKQLEDILQDDDPDLLKVRKRIAELESYADPTLTPGMDDRY
jgi:hypothetical protein